MRARLGRDVAPVTQSLPELASTLWQGKVTATLDDGAPICRFQCGLDHLVPVCQWLSRDLDFAFATLIVEESPVAGRSLVYVFYKDSEPSWAYVELQLDAGGVAVPSISGLGRGPSPHWPEPR